MKLSVHPYLLKFIHPFALAHGTREGTQLAYVRLEHLGITAYGEASLPPYLSETVDTVKAWVTSQESNVRLLIEKNPFEIKNQLPFSTQNSAATSALQSAMVNWYLSWKGESLRNYFPATQSEPGLTLTITKNDTKYLHEKINLEQHFSHFKLKLTGANDDLDFVKHVRSKSSLPFCIDVNQGCTHKEHAIQLINTLRDQNCTLVEQPLNASDHEGHLWLKQRSPLPIIADESIRLFADLEQLHDAYSGVNIKLMKCGGLFEAQKMIDFSNSKTDFLCLMGCMSESSLGVSMAAVLACQCAMADLDAPYLNTNDPFKGFEIKNKKIQNGILSLRPGYSIE